MHYHDALSQHNRHLPLIHTLHQAADRHRQLAQEATDGRTAPGKLVLDLQFQHIGRQRGEVKDLATNNSLLKLGLAATS